MYFIEKGKKMEDIKEFVVKTYYDDIINFLLYKKKFNVYNNKLSCYDLKDVVNMIKILLLRFGLEEGIDYRIIFNSNDNNYCFYNFNIL